MKTSMLPRVITALFLMSAITLLLIACNVNPLTIDEPEIIVTKGATYSTSTLNGSVTMIIPKGAVREHVVFTASVCPERSDCNFFLRMVSIEPYMNFHLPVTLQLKYDGDLCKGGTLPCNGTSFTAYYWNMKEDYMNHTAAKTLFCMVDEEKGTINLNINQTGIYAIGFTGQSMPN